MKRTYVNQIKERDHIEEVFLVQNKTLAMARNGRSYLTLKLMDRSGEVEARIWDRVDEFNACFDRNDFVFVSAKANVYMGKMQLVVQDLRHMAESDVEIADFLPVAAASLEDMLAAFRKHVDSLSDEDFKSLMMAFMEDQRFLEDFGRAPAAKAMHHVYLGGLLEHALAVADLADDVSRRYPVLNRDLLLVGALLHDIGKVTELNYRRSFEYTDAGKLLGHIVIGVEMVDAKVRSIPGFPTEKAILIKHLLLSHHGQYDFGSPKRPKTLEAVVLNFLDDMDSKINGVQTHFDKEPDSDSPWTQYHRLYDRYFFKGYPPDSASGPVVDDKTGQDLQKASSESPTPKSTPSPTGKGGRFSNTLEEQLKEKKASLLAPAKGDASNE